MPLLLSSEGIKRNGRVTIPRQSGDGRSVHLTRPSTTLSTLRAAESLSCRPFVRIEVTHVTSECERLRGTYFRWADLVQET
jgi:hypothetical protein